MNRPLACLTLWLVLRGAGLCAPPETTFQFKFFEKSGPFPVGLKVVDQFDASRRFQNEPASQPSEAPEKGARPIQTLIWYPAETSARAQMTLGDYAALIKTETSFSKPEEHGKSQDFVNSYMQGTLESHTWAFRDAKAAPGHFPLVIYAPSLNAPATENIELCEYLASEGFVVMASPSMGPSSRNMTTDLAGANAEAADISFLIDFARQLPYVDDAENAVIGYSWGGMGALFAAGRDQRITALISLDGSFRYAPEIVQQAEDVHPDRMTIPLLFFSRAEESLESWAAMNKGSGPCASAPSVLNEWTHGDLIHMHMLAMSHIQFSSLFQRSERFRKEGAQFSPADYTLDEGDVSYDWMARYILAFLNAYLKHDEAAMHFLTRSPAGNGVPLHLISITIRRAQAGGPEAGKP
jgi:pimeloyl-ACP methyl ester carboxylesterase